MNDKQWSELKSAVEGTESVPLAAFIVDSPWLPNWHGISILDYFTDNEKWFAAHRAACDSFADVAFLPGFWAEYGMCTEPSAFGARCSFPENEFPYAYPMIRRIEEIDDLKKPDPRKDGLLPFVLKRMEWAAPRMEAIGHAHRFSVSRGPLNIASFLMGTTEFLVAMKTDADRIHRLIDLIADFLEDWHALQRSLHPTIDGIMVLDDVVGFIGEADFMEFAFPALKRLFAPDASVKLFHNDADCLSSVSHYSDAGINLYNPGIQLGMAEIRERAGGRLALLGGIPPRDTLAAAPAEEVAAAVRRQLAEFKPGSKVVHSCAGGMPPGVASGNIAAFLNALKTG